MAAETLVKEEGEEEEGKKQAERGADEGSATLLPEPFEVKPEIVALAASAAREAAERITKNIASGRGGGFFLKERRPAMNRPPTVHFTLPTPLQNSRHDLNLK